MTIGFFIDCLIVAAITVGDVISQVLDPEGPAGPSSSS